MGQSSSIGTVTAGVPQGSIYGTLAFCCIINDLPYHVHSQVDIFADYTTLLAASDFAFLFDVYVVVQFYP